MSKRKQDNVIRKSSDNEKAQLIQLKCKKCAGELTRLNSNNAVCPYCNQKYHIDENEKITVAVKSTGVDGKIYDTIRALGKYFAVIAVVALIIAGIIFAYNKNKEKNKPNDYLKINDKEVAKIFCESIFDKKYKKISAKELAKIKYIEYGYTGYGNEYKLEIKYSFNERGEFESDEAFNEKLLSFTYPYYGLSGNTLNLSMLEGLTGIGPTTVGKIELSDKCKIEYVNTDYDLVEIADMVSPKYVKVLYTTGECDLDVIGKFANLEELVMVNDYSVKEDVCVELYELEKCKTIRKLHLQCGGWYKGLDTLKNLPELKSLYINNTPLEECEFLREMPELEELYVMTGEEGDLSLLSEVANLKVVKFLDYEILDARVLLNLPKLENVSGRFNSEYCFETLSKLPNLKKINISVGLPIMSYYSGDVDISLLADLQNLSEISLRFDRGSDILGLEEVLEMQQLKKFEIAGRPFGMELSISEEDLAVNTSLETFNLEWCFMSDGDYSFLKKLQNLKNLYLVNCEVTDIEFVSELKELETCMLGRNEIESYAPLSLCEKLKEVGVEQRDIEKVDLPAHVNVIISQ